MRVHALAPTLSLLLAALAFAAHAANSATAAPVKPTLANESYGPDKQNTLDFWKAEGNGPRPVLVYIHGGGWINGDKRSTPLKKVAAWLAKGVSCAAINYRHTPKNPLPAPVLDAARAIQHIRYHAKEWNVDKDRIAVTGGSAGGCTSVWLLLHEDLKDEKAADPVLRESTRVCGAAVGSAQTSIDPKVVTEWIGPKVLDHRMIASAVGCASMKDVMDHYDKYVATYKEYSPVNHVSKDDPPLWMQYGSPDSPANNANSAIHHGKFGTKMKEASNKVGHTCYLVYPKGPKQKYPYKQQFLEAMLLGKK